MKPSQKPSKETLNEWHNDPSNWKFGIFYFNKEDKRIFPPKRIKSLGWTINFSNPISVLVIIGIVAMLLILAEN